MCKKESMKTSKVSSKDNKGTTNGHSLTLAASTEISTAQQVSTTDTDTKNKMSSCSKQNQRRGKLVKESDRPKTNHDHKDGKKKKISSSRKRHEGETQSGGIQALLPSFIAIVVIGCAIVAKLGLRGRPTVAGIDLGTTNSVICVQEQSNGNNVGEINCIPDPHNNSPIIPSVASFLDPKHYSKTKVFKKKEELGYHLQPSPSYVIVGSAAKVRIDTHPHHTLYHAKRVLGRSFDDEAVKELMEEVEFNVFRNDNDINEEQEIMNEVMFSVPFHAKHSNDNDTQNSVSISPHQVGSYVINHLMEITAKYLGHDNVKSAVIAVPAKFSNEQKLATVQAYKDVGVKVARILEEPVAAALAYGLQKKESVDYIIVYDFGGGTLDVSVLQVFDGGYVEVIGNDGDNRLGGADFDAAVAHYLTGSNEKYGERIVEKIARILSQLEGGNDEMEQQFFSAENNIEERLVFECPKLTENPLCSFSSFHTMGEKMKIDLSSFESGDGVATSSCYGVLLDDDDDDGFGTMSAFCEKLDLVKFEINSEQYNEACTSLFDRSINPVARILKDLDLSKEEIDEVVMVGGTTRMPQIRNLVKKELGVESLNTSIDPDLTVAYGAASIID